LGRRRLVAQRRLQLAQRRLDLVVDLELIGEVARRLAEGADRLAQRRGDVGQALGSEEDEGDGEDHDELAHAEAKHGYESTRKAWLMPGAALRDGRIRRGLAGGGGRRGPGALCRGWRTSPPACGSARAAARPPAGSARRRASARAAPCSAAIPSR